MAFITSSPLIVLLVFICVCCPCVAESNMVALIGSSAVCGFMLFVIIIMIVVYFIWPGWFQHMMRDRGKVKMPKSYFKKKEEAKKRLLNESIISQSASVRKERLPLKEFDRVSWIQDFNQENPLLRGYEEKDVTMYLGEENDGEFRIETCVVDNEVLDVGPYKTTEFSKATVSTGDIYPEPYIFSTGDRVTVTKSTESTNGVVSSISRSTNARIPDKEMS